VGIDDMVDLTLTMTEEKQQALLTQMHFNEHL